MKNFVKLIKQVYEERYSVVLKKILDEKIPVASLTLAPTAQAVETVRNFRDQGLDITTLFVVNSAPPPLDIDFKIVHLKDAKNVALQSKYVFVWDEIEAAGALKYFPNCEVICLYRGNTDHIYETFMTHLPELQEVYTSLIDEDSKKTFCGYWRGCISNQIGKIFYANTPHYICAGFIPERGAVVIDGGAFDGGTATIFTQMGYKVYAFELDDENFALARKVGEEKNFVVENVGLGSYRHEMTYDKSLSSSRLSETGSSVAQIITLDEYVREKNLPRVDFIKLDVEGAELDVLKGAATTIARFKPILALSAYHKWDDFWTLMNVVKSIRPDYEFAMRQFAISPAEEPSMFERYTAPKLLSLGLDLRWKLFFECMLFAR